MHNKNAPRHTSLVTWQFLVMNEILDVTSQPNSPEFSSCCFYVFVRIKNGLKIRSFYRVCEIQQKARAGPTVITNTISRVSSTNGSVAIPSLCVCRRALLGVTCLGLINIVCKYFA